MIWGLGIAALVILAFLLFLILFEPGLRYNVCAPQGVPLGSDHYLALLGALADAQIHGRSKIEVLDNGDKFYEAELKAIRAAKGQDTSSSEAVIVADTTTPYRLLIEVLFTAGQSEFGKYHLMVKSGKKR